MMPTSRGFLSFAKSNQSFFPESLSDDIIIGIKSNTQRILFGVENAPSVMRISDSNVTIGAQLNADMIAIGGQIIGTGTNVVFSPIDPGWNIVDEQATGFGIGKERFQITSGFVQWANTTIISVPPQTLNITSNIYFNYNDIDKTENVFSKGSINFSGKYISPDFALRNNSFIFNLTGPGGVFTLGFDYINCNLGQYFENLIIRCYYNKSTDYDSFTNFYLIKGSEFVTTMFPSYSALKFVFDTTDNNGITFIPETMNLRITRLSVIE